MAATVPSRDAGRTSERGPIVRRSRVFRTAAVAVTAVVCVLTGSAQATAAAPTVTAPTVTAPTVTAPTVTAPTGTASGGSATVVTKGATVQVPPVGACSLTGTASGSSTGVRRAGLVSYGTVTSTCGVDGKAHTTTSTATGADFALSALTPYGGPTIELAHYRVTCTGRAGGTSATWAYSGLTGILVPKQIPNNYQVAVRSGTGAVLAEVTLNEVVLPKPNDGGITVDLMHIVLFPNGPPPNTAAMSGDVYVGSTSCSPT
jgi:hypothetical protein